MKPILFESFCFRVSGFGFFFSLGCIIPYLLLRRQTRQEGWREGEVESLAIRLFLGAVIGARLLYVLENLPYFIHHVAEIPLAWKGGLSFFGGLVGTILAQLQWARSRKIHPLALLDRLVAFGALSHMFGRLGCLSHGCCYGEHADLPWSVVFPLLTGDRLPRHPTQGYEAILLGLLSCLLFRLWRIKPYRERIGSASGVYLVGYGLIRLTIESFRGDSVPLIMGLLREYQLMAVVCLVAGARLWWRHSPSPDYSAP